MSRRLAPRDDALFGAEAAERERERAELAALLRARPARVVAGVDEAGLGPILGPLTIGYSAFRVPGALDLWRALRRAASREPADDAERLVVADSKLVYARNPRGERRLERTALAFLALCPPERRVPEDGRALLARIPRALAPAAGLEREAWFAHLAGRLPAHGEAGELADRCGALVEALAASSVELVQAGVRVLPVAELNASFEATQNKSMTHWLASAPVLGHLWASHAHEGLDVLVDRHGGRMRYGWLLRGTFPGAAVDVLDEAPERSEYVVEEAAGEGRPARWMRIAFAERAEGASFAVALASCLAKHARETCMAAFNRYFEALQPGLKPTAGYTTDGWRWLEEARDAIERSGLPRAALVRER